jgi:signal transduction histidine kinase
VVVTDDGIGISAADGDDTGEGGFGLIGMRERVELVHGTLSVTPGERRGTVVRAFLPATGDPVLEAVAS